MNKNKGKIFVKAAMLGIFNSMMIAGSHAADKKNTGANDFNKKDVEPCYGINACKAKGQCGGKGTSCAGTNECKGKGWINVEKGHCKDIQGGSLTPPKE